MRTTFLVFFTLLCVTVGFSQEQNNSYTLEEAIAFALENNYTIINANRDLIAAQKQKWETIAAGLPQITGNISYQNQLKQPVSLLPAAAFDNTQSTIDVVNDFFDANQTNFDVNSPDGFIPVVFGTKQQANATATLQQQIFNGSYIVGVQASKVFIKYSQNNKEKTNLEVRRAVVEAYGNVLLALESVAILEQNKATLEKNLFETQKIYENGLGEEESVEQLQITLASVESQLKNGIRLKDITLKMLNIVMGVSLDAPTTLKENLDELTQKQLVLDLLKEDLIMENNIDYKLGYNLNQQRFYELKLAKSRALPTLNAFINYGSTSFSDSFDFFKGDQKWFDSRRASTQRAKIALEKAKTTLVETEERIKLQLKNAKSNYTYAVEQYKTSKSNLALAARIEKKNQVKYFEGLATSFELRQAQVQLYAAQQEYLQSMTDVINKKTALEIILNN